MGVSGKSEVCGSLCHCQAQQLNGSNTNNKSSNKSGGDNLFSPIKKMKVLKKIKKRIGLGMLSNNYQHLNENRKLQRKSII
jgi:hypothetical protein